MTTPITHPRRWDPLVKFTHWSVALAVLANALFTREGSTAHVWVGYSLAAILVLRLLWGFVGPEEARFTAFPPNPLKAIRHVGAIRRGEREEHRSHNPLGALMAYAIWATLAVIVASGIAMAGLPKSVPLNSFTSQSALDSSETNARAGDDRDEYREESENGGEGEEEGEGEEALEEVHEAAVNLLYVLILLHIAGVVFETRRSGRQIVLAMIPGWR